MPESRHARGKDHARARHGLDVMTERPSLQWVGSMMQGEAGGGPMRSGRARRQDLREFLPGDSNGGPSCGRPDSDHLPPCQRERDTAGRIAGCRRSASSSCGWTFSDGQGASEDHSVRSTTGALGPTPIVVKTACSRFKRDEYLGLVPSVAGSGAINMKYRCPFSLTTRS